MEELEERNGPRTMERQKGRNEAGEERADVGGRLVTRGHGDVPVELLPKARLGSWSLGS